MNLQYLKFQLHGLLKYNATMGSVAELNDSQAFECWSETYKSYIFNGKLYFSSLLLHAVYHGYEGASRK